MIVRNGHQEGKAKAKQKQNGIKDPKVKKKKNANLQKVNGKNTN